MFLIRVHVEVVFFGRAMFVPLFVAVALQAAIVTVVRTQLHVRLHASLNPRRGVERLLADRHDGLTAGYIGLAAALICLRLLTQPAGFYECIN